MVYLGRHQQGKILTLEIVTQEVATAVPVAIVYDASGRVHGPVRVPWDGGNRFRLPLCMDDRFPEGRYQAILQVQTGSGLIATTLCWEVIAGDPTGQVTSMFAADRPHGQFVVNGRNSGQIYKGKGPSL